MIKWQGPYASGLLQHLETMWSAYDAIVFFTYLYPTTYYGVGAVKDRHRVFIYPTVHDEAHAYLPIWRKYTNYNLLFLTEEERLISREIWGNSRGIVVGYGLRETRCATHDAHQSAEPYLLYAGRIELAKGVNILLEYFQHYVRDNAQTNINLKLIGKLGMDIGSPDRVQYLGFLNEEQKLEQISNASALAIPSPYESLSIVALEAFMLGTPILVNKHCSVLNGHVSRSRAGLAYANYTEFEQGMRLLTNGETFRANMGSLGKAYFAQNYSWETYTKRVYESLFGGSEG